MPSEVAAKTKPRDQAVGRIELRALGKAQQYCQQQEEPDAGKHRMNDAPAAEGEQRGSRCRRNHGDDHRGDGHIGELRPGGLPLEQVADDGQGDGHACAGACTLDDTPHQEGRQRSGQRAADPGDDEQRARE